MRKPVSNSKANGQQANSDPSPHTDKSEVIFHGSPAEFIAVVRAWRQQVLARDNVVVVWDYISTLDNVITGRVELMDVSTRLVAGEVIARPVPNGHTLLSVIIPNRNALIAGSIWYGLRSELERMGWIRADRVEEKVSQSISVSQPNLRTQHRFAVFSRLKNEHPSWSQDKVAMESRVELGEIVSAETVRNTYRIMGAQWLRGDRVR